MTTDYLSDSLPGQKALVRRARLSDVPELLSIYNTEVIDGLSTMDTVARTLDEWEEWFYQHQTPDRPLIVAEIDGKAVGYACLSNYRPRDGYACSVELSIYVDRAYRGRGFAKMLMAAILDMARERSSIHAVMSVITADNEPSRRLHERFAFENCGRVRQCAYKHGSYHDIEFYELIVGNHSASEQADGRE